MTAKPGSTLVCYTLEKQEQHGPVWSYQTGGLEPGFWLWGAPTAMQGWGPEL